MSKKLAIGVFSYITGYFAGSYWCIKQHEDYIKLKQSYNDLTRHGYK